MQLNVLIFPACSVFFCLLTEREMEFSTSNLRQTFISEKPSSGNSECVQHLVGCILLW